MDDDDDTNKFSIFNSSPEIKTYQCTFTERFTICIVSMSYFIHLKYFYACRYIYVFVLSPSFPLQVVSIFYFISLNQICFLCGTNRVFLLFFFIFSRRKKGESKKRNNVFFLPSVQSDPPLPPQSHK